MNNNWNHNPLLPPQTPAQKSSQVLTFVSMLVAMLVVGAVLANVFMGEKDTKYSQSVVDFYIDQGYNVHCINDYVIALHPHPEQIHKKDNKSNKHKRMNHLHNVTQLYDENNKAIKCEYIDPKSITELKHEKEKHHD